MPSSSPIGGGSGNGMRPISLGPISSILWTFGLVAILFFLARAAIDESHGSSVEGDTACQTVLTWRKHPIFSLAWSPDGRRLAASGWGSEVRVWDLTMGITGSLESDDGRPRFVLGWSPDGLGVTVSDLSGGVELWETDEARRPAEAKPAGPANVGRAMALASRGTSIRLWGPMDRRSELLPPGARSARAMAFTPDGRTMASAGLEGVVRVWESGSGKLRWALSMGGIGISAVAFSPDGTRLSTGGGGSARVWDVASGRELARVGDPVGGFSTLAFSPDGRRLACAAWGGNIQVWDLETGRKMADLRGHESQVVTMAWSPDGRRLASAGHGGTVRISDLDQSP